MDPEEGAKNERDALKKAGRAIVIIRIVMGLFILIPLVLAWWLGLVRF